jgi:hypothetical protein
MNIYKINFAIVKDALAGKINKEFTMGLSVFIGFVSFVAIAFGINYFTLETTFNYGLWFFLWGLIGAFIAKRVNTTPTSEILWTLPLYVSYFVGIFFMNLFYLPFRKR